MPIKIETGLTQDTLFMSDLHMGDRSEADDFNSWLFAAELQRLPKEWRLVILGDAYETWQASVPDIMKQHSPTISALKERNAVFIGGNHDAIMGFPEFWREGNVVAFHGHQADLANSKYGWFARTVTSMAGWCERRGWQVDEQYESLHRRVERWMGKRWRKATGRNLRIPYMDYCVALLARERALIVPFGHTHEQFLRQGHKGHVIGNCGHSMNGIQGILADAHEVRSYP